MRPAAGRPRRDRGGLCGRLLDRLARAANGRFPPSWALGYGSIGLTAVVLTPEPVTLADDALIAASLQAPLRSRVVPLAWSASTSGKKRCRSSSRAAPPACSPNR